MLLAATLGGLVCAPVRAAGSTVEEPWLRIETENFTIFCHASERVGLEVGAGLERLRWVLSRLGGGFELNSPLPTSIYVFRDDEAFTPYKIFSGGRPSSLGGYFLSHQFGNYVAVNGDPFLSPRRIVFHEYLHYLLRNSVPGIPLWLNEGIAELYSTFDDASAHPKLGDPVDSHLAWLRRAPLVPLKSLVAVTKDSPQYNEAERKGGFYAQSWVLAHYLLLGDPKRAAETRRFLDLVRIGAEADEAFSIAFEGGFEALDQELRKYVKARRFPVLRLDDLALELALVEGKAAVTPLSTAEVEYRLGDLLAHAVPERAAAARHHFERALELDPGYGLAWSGLGFLEDKEGDYGPARELHAKARKLAPGEARVHFLAGRNRLLPVSGESFSADREGTPADGAELVLAREAFRRALELSPDFPEALAGYGSTYLLGEEVPDGAVDALERAFEQLPSRRDVAYNLALAYSTRNDWEKAEDIIESVLRPQGELEMIGAIRAQLVSQAISRAYRGIELGREDEARGQLEYLAAELETAGYDRGLVAQLRDLERYISQRSEADRYGVAVRLYSRGVEAASAGDIATAIGLLSRIPGLTEDGTLRARAQRKLKKLRGQDGDLGKDLDAETDGAQPEARAG